MTKPKRVRKPRDTKEFYSGFDYGMAKTSLYDKDSGNVRYNLRDAKRLHKWLGQAIAYLEQESKVPK